MLSFPAPYVVSFVRSSVTGNIRDVRVRMNADRSFVPDDGADGSSVHVTSEGRLEARSAATGIDVLQRVAGVWRVDPRGAVREA